MRRASSLAEIQHWFKFRNSVISFPRYLLLREAYFHKKRTHYNELFMPFNKKFRTFKKSLMVHLNGQTVIADKDHALCQCALRDLPALHNA